ncbi:doublesex- and mab-3-related transcription factor B1-like [Arapaima gigas]
MPRLSKPQKPPEEATHRVQRNPKCSRCRNHGFVVKMKGHSGGCPFVHCKCWKCSLITQRTSIMASHRRLKAHRASDYSASGSGEARSRRTGGGPDGRGVESQCEMRMPQGVKADGESYGETEVPGKPQNESNAAGKDAGGAVSGGSDSAEREGQRWTPVNPHFPVNYVLAKTSQRETYTGELLTMPVPVKLYSCYPSSCPIPRLLVNLPPVWPGGLLDPMFRFPHFQPSSVPNSLVTGLSCERPLPLFPHPREVVPGVQEERNLTLFLGPVSHVDQGAGMQLDESQESEVIFVDSDSSTQNAL